MLIIDNYEPKYMLLASCRGKFAVERNIEKLVDDDKWNLPKILPSNFIWHTGAVSQILQLQIN